MSFAAARSRRSGTLTAIRQDLINRWIASSTFMSGRRYRLGPLYRMMGVVAETMVSAANWRHPASRVLPAQPKSIFVLRNNDIGDLIVTMPLFDALRRRFPAAHIAVGVGSWNKATLENNPHIDEVITVDAPWYNHFTRSRSIAAALDFATHSPAVTQLKARHFDIGIDVLGSHFGGLLMINAGIPYRVGMKGYAGGHSALSVTAPFRDDEHVSRNILRLAEALGATDLPEPRAQLFLSDAERVWAQQAWSMGRQNRQTRVLLGCGGKSNKIWPMDRWIELVKMLSTRPGQQIGLVGGPQDVKVAEELQSVAPDRILNWAGTTTIRETFALVASADQVACNDSMLSHVSAAFSRPVLTLLGPSTLVPEQRRIWGYPPPSRMVGREEVGKDIATPKDAFNLLLEMGCGAGSLRCGG
jgi:heptosyltransferase-2